MSSTSASTSNKHSNKQSNKHSNKQLEKKLEENKFDLSEKEKIMSSMSQLKEQNEKLRKENEQLREQTKIVLKGTEVLEKENKELREAWEREMKESQRLRDVINGEEDDEEESSSDDEELSSDEEEEESSDKYDMSKEMLREVIAQLNKERDFEHIRFLEEQTKRSDLEQVIHEIQRSGNAYKLEVLTKAYKQLKSQFNNIIELIKTADTDEKIKLLKELDFLN